MTSREQKLDTILACIGGLIMLALYVGALVQQGM